MCLFICSQPFPSLFLVLSYNGGLSLHFHDNKTFGLLLKIGEFFILATYVSFFRPVLAFLLNIAQTIRMKILAVFIEDHLYHLCNMILEEKETQAIRGTLETPAIFSVRDS